jgi:hypothetical protein
MYWCSLHEKAVTSLPRLGSAAPADAVPATAATAAITVIVPTSFLVNMLAALLEEWLTT